MEYNHFYFAYANNMNEDLIRTICPGAKFEGVGELRRHRFDFNQQGQPVVIEDKEHSVWGVIWCLSVRDINMLDEKESKELGNFSKVTKTVLLQDNREADAFIYLPTEFGKPTYSLALLSDIIDQADYWSLPKSYLSYLKSLISITK